MDYWPPATARTAGAVLADPPAPMYRAMPWAATITSCCGTACSDWPNASAAVAGPFGYRAFADSAPVLEKALARNAGLGWIGKHTNLINATCRLVVLPRRAVHRPAAAGGSRRLTQPLRHLPACMRCLPDRRHRRALQLDARRCISYLTIELRGPIPEPLRPLIGNRIFGCDDCQLVCPWNRFARPPANPISSHATRWTAAHSSGYSRGANRNSNNVPQGSAIRRIGYACWLRNIAVALGNAPTAPEVISALNSRKAHPLALVREHVDWALRRHGAWSAAAERGQDGGFFSSSP